MVVFHRFATFVTIRVRRVFVCGCRVALLRFSLSRLWLSNREVTLREKKDRIPKWPFVFGVLMGGAWGPFFRTGILGQRVGSRHPNA